MTGRVVDSLEISERFLVGLAPHDFRAGRGELRRSSARAGPPARPAFYDRGLRQPLRQPALCLSMRRADGRVLGRRRRDGDVPRHGLRRASERQVDRRRRIVHRRRPGTMARPSGHDQGARRPGLHRRDQSLRLSPLRHAAVARPPAGHDHGPLGNALRTHANLVGTDARLAPIPGPLPVPAPPGHVCRRPLLPDRRGFAAGPARPSATGLRLGPVQPGDRALER